MMILLIVYIVINISFMLAAMLEAWVEFDVTRRNAAFICTDEIYKATNYNKSYCKFLSILLNLLIPGYNIGLSLYAIYYYLTRKGRDGNFNE